MLIIPPKSGQRVTSASGEYHECIRSPVTLIRVSNDYPVSRAEGERIVDPKGADHRRCNHHEGSGEVVFEERSP